jgi:hypothetical protein
MKVIQQRRNITINFNLFVVIISTTILLYIFLVPPYENPDERTHIQNTLRTDKLNIKITGDGNLYYFLNNKIYNFFGNEFNISSIKENPDFDYFSDQYRYDVNQKKYLLSFNEVYFFRLLNFIYLFIFIFIYRISYINQKYNKILYLSFVFPGFIYFLSTYNPDVLIVISSLLFFILFFEKKHLEVIIMLLFMYFFLDRTILLFIASMLSYIVFVRLIELFPKYKNLKFMVYAIIIYFIGINLIDKIIYLNWDYEPIKSIATLSLSFYGLMGNMSIRSSFIEYILFYFLLFFLIFNIVFNLKSKNTNKEYLLFLYFIFWLIILKSVPTLDQGRYFYPLMFIVSYLFLKHVKILRYINAYQYILLIILINFHKFVKLLYLSFS